MTLTLANIHLGASHPQLMVGYDGGSFYAVSVDSAGRLAVIPMQYDANSMDFVPVEGASGTGTEVQVMNWPGSFAVTGSFLTDAQLRATPVPVSGTFYPATQPVSGTFWQATQPVSGPMTQVEYKACSLEAIVVYESGDISYVCKAPIGTALSSAAWQIKKVDASSGVVITWCDGDANYNNTATDLATVAAHSYS